MLQSHFLQGYTLRNKWSRTCPSGTKDIMIRSQSRSYSAIATHVWTRIEQQASTEHTFWRGMFCFRGRKLNGIEAISFHINVFKEVPGRRRALRKALGRRHGSATVRHSVICTALLILECNSCRWRVPQVWIHLLFFLTADQISGLYQRPVGGERHEIAWLAEELCCKPEGCRFHSRWGHWSFPLA